VTLFFFEGIFDKKNLEIDLQDGFVLFFEGYLSSLLFSRLFTSSLNNYVIKE
jgi:hypothetical protein